MKLKYLMAATALVFAGLNVWAAEIETVKKLSALQEKVQEKNVAIVLVIPPWPNVTDAAEKQYLEDLAANEEFADCGFYIFLSTEDFWNDDVMSLVRGEGLSFFLFYKGGERESKAYRWSQPDPAGVLRSLQ